jgi:hypothetical protein
MAGGGFDDNAGQFLIDSDRQNFVY